MTGYDTISTETWKVRLPSDWSERECSGQHTSYFESADGTKGAYFSTWWFHDDPRPAREILESFHRVEVRSLYEMKNNTWEQVGEWATDTPESSILGADFLDLSAHYRIVCHLVVRLPWLVRSGFHDYNCADLGTSKAFFQPIIESLQIHHDNG